MFQAGDYIQVNMAIVGNTTTRAGWAVGERPREGLGEKNKGVDTKLYDYKKRDIEINYILLKEKGIVGKKYEESMIGKKFYMF